MKEDQLRELWNKGVVMMMQGYTWAEATLQVLRDVEGWGFSPYQWAAAGYSGAIDSGKTICGMLFGATVFLGFMFGEKAPNAPGIKDEKRILAIASVNGLFNGFISKFGETECRALTGCDFSNKEEVNRYIREEVYKNTCFRQFEYVLSYCTDQRSADLKTQSF